MITINKNKTNPKIALSTRFSVFADELIRFAREHSFDGIEYTIQDETSSDLKKHIHNMQILVASGLEVRYHLQFKKVELAHKDREFAMYSVKHYKECIDLISDMGGRYIVVHLCLGYRFELHKMQHEHAVKYLSHINGYANKKNITLCLENITFGFTNTPSVFYNLVKETGVNVTIDIGHIATSPIVLNETISDIDFILKMKSFIASAHVYDKEVFNEKEKRGVHVAPKDKEAMRPRLNALTQSSGDWWLIELGDKNEILKTAAYARDIFI